MSLLKLATDTLVDALRAAVCEHTVLVGRDDFFELKRSPSLILQGPKLEEHAERRTMDRLVETDRDAGTFTEQDFPRLYHADFEVILTCAKQEELFEKQQKLLSFVQRTPWLVVDEKTKFALVEMTPLGGLQKPNLSNLRQAVGIYRIEDVPVFGGEVREGKLITKAIFEFRDAPNNDPYTTVETTQPAS